jgi:hypothetical protein
MPSKKMVGQLPKILNYIKVGGVEMYIDLGAEAIVAAEREGQKIAVEIKSFLGASSISEFHTALGQFFNYRLALEDKDPRSRSLSSRADRRLRRVFHLAIYSKSHSKS